MIPSIEPTPEVAQVIERVCRRHRLTLDHVQRHGKTAAASVLRRDLILTLRRRGHSGKQIARWLRCDTSTVGYWMRTTESRKDVRS